MVKRLKPLAQGFNSSSGPDGNIRATADPVTNSLRIRIPADNPDQMTVAAAFISREEFLHGKWNVGIVHTLAHLSLSAGDALKQIVTADSTHNLSKDSYIEIIKACYRTESKLLGPMKPFVEAVDKFQLLSVIDEEFVNAVQETYKAAINKEEAREFDEFFEEVRKNEIEVATGQRPSAGENVYVNPLYFYALSDIVVSDWGEVTDQSSDTSGKNTAQGRTIAEAVARATLDVPYPIEPLGTERSVELNPLCTPDVELDPINHSRLISDDMYPMSRQEFRQYLGDYPKSDRPSSEVIGEFGDISVNEIEFNEYSYEDAKSDWVARAFVNVRKQLDNLRGRDDVELGEIDTEELRQLLVEGVHDVDVSTTSTMRDQPTALLDVPQKVETNAPNEDVMSAEGKPLPKVLMEAFEQHGSFGTVIYNLSENNTKYQQNWHTKNYSVDSQHYLHVPAEIENYNQLWHYHYFWRGVTQKLWETYHEYREQLISDLAEEIESKKEAERLISRTTDRPVESSYPENPLTPVSPAADNREAEGFVGIDDHFENFEKHTLLEEESSLVLVELAKELKIPTKVEYDTTECPLCNIRSGSCGLNGECANEGAIADFESKLPHLIERLIHTWSNTGS